MTHLHPEELVDLADGIRSEADHSRVEGHLSACASCRQQLADLRATLSTVAGVDVPEPSPLFWDHLSRRVHDAVAAEDVGGGPRPWWVAMVRMRGLWPAYVIAGLLLFVLVPGLVRSMRPVEPPPLALVPLAPAGPGAPARDTLADLTDPSLGLVADLADGIGWDGARAAGLAPRGSAEHAVTHLNDSELRELQRLLQVELAHATD